MPVSESVETRVEAVQGSLERILDQIEPLNPGARSVVMEALADISESVNDLRFENEGLAASKSITAEELARQKLIFRNLYDAVVVSDLEGRIIDWNRGAEKMFGYTREEALGQTPSFLQTKHEPAGLTQAIVSNVRLKGQWTGEINYEHKNGTEGTCQSIVAPMFNDLNERVAAVGVYRDVTEEKRAVEALMQSEQRYRVVSELSSDFAYVLRIETDGRVNCDWMTDAFGRVTGFNAKEVEWGVGGSSLIRKEDKRKVEQRSRHLLSGAEDVSEFKIITRNGNECWLRDYRRPVFNDSKTRVVYIFGASQDITKRKQAEEELQNRAEFETLITSISTRFISLKFEEIDDEINRALAAIGEFTGVNRSFVFQFSSDQQHLINTHEWCSMGAPSLMKEYQKFPVTDFSWSTGKYKKAEPIIIPRLSDFPKGAGVEKSECLRNKIEALVCISMVCAGKVIGYVGIHSHEERVWPGDLVSLVKIVGEIFANTLERERARREIETLNRELEQRVLIRTAELRESEARLRLITEEVPAILWTVDTKLTITYISGAGLSRLNSESDDLIGHSLSEVLELPGPGDATISAHEQALQGESVNFEFELKGRLFDSHIEPLRDSKGEIVGCVGVCVDKTERRAMETELQHASKMAMLGRMAAGIAHEIGNPLASISARLQRLKRKREPEFIDDTIELLTSQTDRMTRIVRNVSDLSRIPRVEWAECNVRKVLYETVRVLQLDRRSQAIEINQHCEDVLLMQGSADQLQQVFLNIGLNAFDAMPDGGVLDIAVHETENEILVEFSDTGKGIAPETQLKIFDPFFTTKPFGSGMGLGLWLSQEHVHAHGGNIEADSSDAGGGLFRVRLPRVQHR